MLVSKRLISLTAYWLKGDRRNILLKRWIFLAGLFLRQLTECGMPINKKYLTSFVRIEVVLPGRQAFIVKKWADEAKRKQEE